MLKSVLSLWNFTLGILVASVIGILVNVYYVDNPGSVSHSLTNAYVALWLCLTLFFVTIQSLIIQVPPAEPQITKNVRKWDRKTFLQSLLMLVMITIVLTMFVFIMTNSSTSWLPILLTMTGIPTLCAVYLIYTNAALEDIDVKGSAWTKSALTVTDDAMYGLMAVFGCVTAIGWFAFGRIDVTVWSILLVIVCLVNLVLLTFKLKEINDWNDECHEQKRLGNPFAMAHQELKFTWAAKIMIGLDLTLKAVVFMIAALLLNGAILHGSGGQMYPIVKGKYLSYTLGPDGPHQTVMYRCEGQKTSLPTLIFESDGSHGLGDWIGILHAMNGRHRICVWDKPGLGFSDYLRGGQYRSGEYYVNLVDSLIEQEPDFGPPYIFVGWGGGGELVYEYSLVRPENVHSLVMLDVALPDVEWRLPAIVGNWTEEEYHEHVQRDLQNRLNFCHVVNGLGVPFGLISLFYPQSLPSEFWDINEAAEKDWYFLTEKTWISQYWFITEMDGNATNIFDHDTSGITVHAIMTRLSDDQIDHLVCYPNELTVDECDEQKAINRLMIEEKRSIVKHGGTILDCMNDDCNLGYYVFDNPVFTVDAILDIYGM